MKRKFRKWWKAVPVARFTNFIFLCLHTSPSSAMFFSSTLFRYLSIQTHFLLQRLSFHFSLKYVCSLISCILSLCQGLLFSLAFFLSCFFFFAQLRSYSPRNQLRLTKLAEKCFVICMHMQFPSLYVLQVLNPGVRGRGVVTRFVVKFAIGPCGRVEVHIIPGGLESEVHIQIGGGRGTMGLILKKWLFKVPSGVFIDGVCLVVLARGLLWCGQHWDLRWKKDLWVKLINRTL